LQHHNSRNDKNKSSTYQIAVVGTKKKTKSKYFQISKENATLSNKKRAQHLQTELLNRKSIFKKKKQKYSKIITITNYSSNVTFANQLNSKHLIILPALISSL
jgi:histidinol dehydrogenase